MFVGVKVNVRKSYLARILIFVICDSAVRAVDTTMCSAHNFMFHEGRRTYERVSRGLGVSLTMATLQKRHVYKSMGKISSNLYTLPGIVAEQITYDSSSCLELVMVMYIACLEHFLLMTEYTLIAI